MRFIFTIHIKEIYYKELAQAIMEAEGVPKPAVQRPENQESQWYKFQSQTGETNVTAGRPAGREQLLSCSTF